MLIDSSKPEHKDFRDILNQYEKAKIWLESYGVRVSSSRFDAYKKVVEESLDSPTNVINVNQEFDILWAFAELHDLLDIYEYLSNVKDQRFIESLRKIASGPHLLEDEKSDGGSVQGRNFTFELYTASRLVRSGVPVEFTSIADANFQIGEINCHLECKRVVSENKMDKLIESACKQIQKRCESTSSDRGIVAVSISKLVWKAQRESAKGVYGDVKKMQADMREILDYIGPLITNQFKSYRSSTVAIILHCKIPFRTKQDGVPIFLNRFCIYPLAEEDSPDFLIFRSIENKLRQSTGGIA